jgi:hypothetical protein
MIIHNFADSLRLSHSQANAPWWEPVYRQFFPTFQTMVDIRQDGWAQRGGIDRIVILAGGKQLLIDEKVRSANWNDVLLEYWSDRDRRIKGWIAQDLAIHYLAYAFIPSQKCLLFPFDLLRRAWFLNRRRWIHSGEYRQVEAFNKGYVTVSVAIPTAELLDVVKNTMLATWNDPIVVMPSEKIVRRPIQLSISEINDRIELGRRAWKTA